MNIYDELCNQPTMPIYGHGLDLLDQKSNKDILYLLLDSYIHYRSSFPTFMPYSDKITYEQPNNFTKELFFSEILEGAINREIGNNDTKDLESISLIINEDTAFRNIIKNVFQ